MKRISIKGIISLLLVAFCAFTIAFLLPTINKVSADTQVVSSFTIEGVSVRFTAPDGIRFKTSMSKTDFDNIYKEGAFDSVTVGTLIIPKVLLGDNDLTLDRLNDDIKPDNYVFSKDKAVLSKDGETMYFNAVMTEIPQEYNGVEFAASSYVILQKGDDTTVEYAKVVGSDRTIISKSYDTVAKETLNFARDDQNYEITDAQKEFLQTIAKNKLEISLDLSKNPTTLFPNVGAEILCDVLLDGEKALIPVDGELSFEGDNVLKISNFDGIDYFYLNNYNSGTLTATLKDGEDVVATASKTVRNDNYSIPAGYYQDYTLENIYDVNLTAHVLLTKDGYVYGKSGSVDAQACYQNVADTSGNFEVTFGVKMINGSNGSTIFMSTRNTANTFVADYLTITKGGQLGGLFGGAVVDANAPTINLSDLTYFKLIRKIESGKTTFFLYVSENNEDYTFYGHKEMSDQNASITVGGFHFWIQAPVYFTGWNFTSDITVTLPGEEPPVNPDPGEQPDNPNPDPAKTFTTSMNETWSGTRTNVGIVLYSDSLLDGQSVQGVTYSYRVTSGSASIQTHDGLYYVRPTSAGTVVVEVTATYNDGTNTYTATATKSITVTADYNVSLIYNLGYNLDNDTDANSVVMSKDGYYYYKSGTRLTFVDLWALNGNVPYSGNFEFTISVKDVGANSEVFFTFFNGGDFRDYIIIRNGTIIPYGSSAVAVDLSKLTYIKMVRIVNSNNTTTLAIFTSVDGENFELLSKNTINNNGVAEVDVTGFNVFLNGNILMGKYTMTSNVTTQIPA